MAKQKKKSRWIGRILLLILLVLALAVAWFFLAPTFKTAGSVTEYLPYTVESRDITTSRSFSGTVEVLHTQQISSAEGQTVREIFVENSQMVKKGDKLIQLEDGEIHTANMDGMVNQVRAREGAYAVPGQTLVQVCDLTNLQITLSVDEYDISSFSIGQPCQMYFLALEETFEGEVSHINKVSASIGTMSTYTVSIELTAPENVLPGMQVCVTIPQKQLNSVAALPIEAISFDDEGACVYISSEGEMVRQAVTLGENDQQYVQLEEGALPGETVYVIKSTVKEPEEVTLSTLYQRIFGTTVVINEPRQSGGSNERQRPAAMPQGTEMPEDLPQPDAMQDYGDPPVASWQNFPGQQPGQDKGE